ncbi:hypothetical protein NDU88_000591 [Pleurodeles waltl]|uniref:Uncharacterized protein n=1 Tax=Pleurodeles waltl TaxID=8319 RepID=A0AAV7UQE8_PLEWA|nr:hypothetical protein NDU88_000591 [Pleurodeles waltl]
MRNQSWAKPGQVPFRRFASLCVGGVDAAGLQIGTGSVNQGGPRTREQRHPAPNSGSRWRMVQGDSTLPRLTRDNQRSSRAALGVESPVVGIRRPLGLQHRRTDCASPRGAYPKRAPRLLVECSSAARRHQVPPLEQGANSPPDAPIRTPPPPSGWARVRIRCRVQHTAQSGISAAIRRRPRRSRPTPGRTSSSGPLPGPRPRLSSPGRTSRSPSALRHGEPPSPARLGPARRQARGLSPQSRAAPATREPAPGGESAPPWSPPRPQQSSHSLWARDRPI